MTQRTPSQPPEGPSAYTPDSRPVYLGGGPSGPPPAAPAAPTLLSATLLATTQDVAVAWTDNATTETAYHLERSVGDNQNFVLHMNLAAGSTAYTDKHLVPGLYFYRVRCSNAGGPSDYSNEDSETVVLVVPTAPSNCVATAVANNIEVTWEDNSFNEDSMILERSVGDNLNYQEYQVLPADTQAYTDAGQAANTYFYRVKARNLAGDSPPSNEDSATLEVPAAPTNCVAAPVYPDVNITWAGTGIGETAVVVQRSVISGSGFSDIQSLAPGSAAYTDINPSPMVWYYRIVNRNLVGDSVPSNEDSAMIKGVPAQPINLEATAA